MYGLDDLWQIPSAIISSKAFLASCKSIQRKMSGMNVWKRASGVIVMGTLCLLMGEQKLRVMMQGNLERMEDHWS